MRDQMRVFAVAGLLGVLAAACGGESGPTTTRFIPPTSEVIFQAPTTTTRAPGPLDPVRVESLGVTVDVPRDWVFETESLRFGRASAAYRAENNAGGLIIIGDVADVLPEGSEPRNAGPADLAPILATLLNVADPLPQDAVRPTAGPTNGKVDGTAYAVTTFAVTEASGATATMQVAVYEDTFPVVFIAVLYEEGFPPPRIEQTRIFETLTLN